MKYPVDWVSMMFDWRPVFLSLKIASAALVFVATLGIWTAYQLARRNFPGKAALETLITLPLVLPPVVAGFIILLLIGRQGPIGWLMNAVFHTQLVFTPYAAILAALVVSFPLMVQSAKAAFQSVDLYLEDVARSLGAGEIKIFFTVTLPLAWPGLLSGMVLSFSRSLGEFGATALVAGNIPGKTQTIPVAIFFAAEENELKTAGYYVLIISILTFAMVFWVNCWSKRKMVRNRKRFSQRGADPC